MIGRALGSIGQWDLAAQAFQQAVSISAGYGEAWGFLGESRYHLDGSGKSELDKALELAPESPVVRALVALYWRRMGEPQKALDHLQAIAAQEPDEPVWKVEIANTLVDTGDLVSAQDYFQQAVKLAPESSLYWQYLARFSAEYDVDPRTLGLPAARKAILLAPEDAAALDTMGQMMTRLGDRASAERFLQRALKSDATYAQAYLHLGQIYLQQDVRRAHPYLKRAAELAGESPEGITARRLLQNYFGEGG
jgi:tetratricopeptide (TPR) repeat protein